MLLNLQHAFEMLLKAIIWEERAEIQPKSGGNSYALRECLGIVRGMGKLSEDEAVVAATIAAHRDAVQHQGAHVSEERLYLDAGSGLRLFDDLLARCFNTRLADYPDFASRMLPVSANPPREMFLLTSSDVEQIRDLLKRPKHRNAEALAFLRTLVVSEQAANDLVTKPTPPTEKQLQRVAKKLQEADDWTAILPGIARLSLEQDEGMTYNLRILKSKEPRQCASCGLARMGRRTQRASSRSPSLIAGASISSSLLATRASPGTRVKRSCSSWA